LEKATEMALQRALATAEVSDTETALALVSAKASELELASARAWAVA
jgi:hypothetical protein